jgi:hypothetical protein
MAAARATADDIAGPSKTTPPNSPKPVRSPKPRSPAVAAPSTPGVPVTLQDGSTAYVPSSVFRSAVASPASKPLYDRLFIYDSGWGGVSQVLAFAKRGLGCLVHIKNSSAGFPMVELEKNLRGMPGGSHLEMKSTIDGIVIIALAYKFNSKKTLFFSFAEGCATTTAGQPYVTQWPDENGNVLTREVDRPAAPSRYFLTFNSADTHDHRRQHELALEQTWVGKGPDAGKFRIYTSIEGITIVDTFLAVIHHSHRGHDVRAMTTQDFAERLAEEMIDNELDGSVSRPSTRRKRPVTEAALTSQPEDEGLVHRLVSMGHYSEARRLKAGEKDSIIQVRCDVCLSKCSTYCAAAQCKRAPICATHKRNCFAQHKEGVSQISHRVKDGGVVKRRRRGSTSSLFPALS